jgi:hypothetical protein
MKDFVILSLQMFKNTYMHTHDTWYIRTRHMIHTYIGHKPTYMQWWWRRGGGGSPLCYVIVVRSLSHGRWHTHAFVHTSNLKGPIEMATSARHQRSEFSVWPLVLLADIQASLFSLVEKCPVVSLYGILGYTTCCCGTFWAFIICTCQCRLMLFSYHIKVNQPHQCPGRLMAPHYS